MKAARAREAGSTLVALVATVTIGLVLMAAGAPTWRYLMKDAEEEELIFRGGQIADAIQRYQRKNANALPPSLEVLVKGKYLRKAYTDPMTKSGKWRFLRPGEALPGVALLGVPNRPGTPTTTRPPSPASAPSTIGGAIGAIQGVVSTSEEKSLRVLNGRTKYNEWLFLPGQPRIVGKTPAFGPGVAPISLPGSSPGAAGPTPLPAPVHR